MTNHYELLYLVSVKYIEADLQKVRDEVKVILDKNQAKITLDEILSKQKLAYPIKHIHQATYIVVEFDMSGENLKEVNKQLKLLPEILRHLIIKKRIKSEAELAQEKRFKEKLSAEEEETTAQEKKTELIIKPEKKAVEVKEKPEKTKVSLDDLDKKLDELLKEDVL